MVEDGIADVDRAYSLLVQYMFIYTVTDLITFFQFTYTCTPQSS